MLQALHEQMAASVHEISNLIDPVGVAARSEASQLGHKVKHRTTAAPSKHWPGLQWHWLNLFKPFILESLELVIMFCFVICSPHI